MPLLSRLTAPAGSTHALIALFLALAMAVVVGAALGFEHLGGYIPCALCLAQRTPYYIGVPVMALAALNAFLGGPAVITRSLFLVGGGLMIWGGAMGVYHAGVEWHFWPGPASCATAAQAVTTDAGSLLSDLNAKKPPSCDTAALRVLGLSFAGWNVIASAVLAVIALRGALKVRAA